MWLSIRAPATRLRRRAGPRIDGLSNPVGLDRHVDGFVSQAQQQEELARLRERRQDAVWYLVVGVAMLFAAGFHWGLGAGGVLMVLFGGARYLQAGARMKALDDPWDDPEIDAWEARQLQEEE